MIILLSVVAACLYSLVFFTKSIQAGEKIDWHKLIATLTVGLGIGVVALLNGAKITEEYIVNQLVAYAGLVMLIENIIKIVWRGIKV